MKKKLLFLVFLLFTFFYSNAQVIDIIGKGTNGALSSNLQFTDIDNIDHIDVGVIKSWGPSITVSDVTFSNFNGNATTTLHSDIINKSGFPSAPGEYLTASFSEVDASGIDVNIIDDVNNFKDYIQSYYAFVYRNLPDATYKSFASLETIYFYWTEPSFTAEYIYNIAIDGAAAPRDITVKIPISELRDDRRPAIIDITAGSKTEHIEVKTYDLLGKSLFIGEYTLTDVPGNVTNVEVKIYSPNPNNGQANGDSFYVNGVVVDVDIVEEGCTLTQGYWKTHADPNKSKKYDETWDLITHFDGGIDDAADTWFFKTPDISYIKVLNTQPSNKNGKYYILAHQYIAAELNILAGANAYIDNVQTTFDEATLFLETNSPEDVKGDKGLEDECVRLGEILDDFNNGRIGPGHCDDNDEQASIEPDKQQRTKVAIYPNPATTYGKIEFTSKQNAKTTVELYNINGQKVGVLFNEKTKIGTPVTIEYDTEQFKKGIYFAIITNGSDVYKEKISIIK